MENTGDDRTSEPQGFHCPTCGAALKFGRGTTVTCDYCGGTVLVPEEFRQPEPAVEPSVVVIKLNEVLKSPVQPVQTRRLGAALALSLVVFLVIAGVVVALATAAGGFGLASTNRIVENAAQQYGTQKTAAANALRPIGPQQTITPLPVARLVLQFGSEGSGSGQFEDARNIVVDEQGNIFVAEYSGGRVQKFSPNGKYLIEWQASPPGENPNLFIDGMAVDGQGNLFITISGSILQFRTADGSLVDAIEERWPEQSYGSLAHDASQGLFVINEMGNRDDVLALDAQGQVKASFEKLVTSIDPEDPAMALDLEVGSAGELYVLGSFSGTVYTFDSQGKLLFRFGERGEAPGQFESFPDQVATGPDGSIFVVVSYDVLRFDPQGHFTGQQFEVSYDIGGGVPRDLFIDPQGDLYIITAGGKVMKYRLEQP